MTEKTKKVSHRKTKTKAVPTKNDDTAANTTSVKIDKLCFVRGGSN